jgi:hypothetical protein
MADRHDRIVERRSVAVDAPPAEAFAPIRRMGGERGWYYADRLWALRGLLDRLLGGVGMRRGRRDPEELAVGDALDFWRVEAYEPPRRLRLCAEMKVPGRAWLEFEVSGDGAGGSIIRQTVEFAPAGPLGRLYWYGILPLHTQVFRGMLRAVAERATGTGRRPAPASAP